MLVFYASYFIFSGEDLKKPARPRTQKDYLPSLAAPLA